MLGRAEKMRGIFTACRVANRASSLGMVPDDVVGLASAFRRFDGTRQVSPPPARALRPDAGHGTRESVTPRLPDAATTHWPMV